jgi:lipoate-protein ligase A
VASTQRPEVRVDSASGLADALRFQETWLRRGTPGIHVAVVDRPTLSVGAGVPEDAPYLERARAEGLPTARRTSGGAGIVHLDGDLAWAVVLPRDDPRVGRDFVRAYGRLGAGLVQELARHQQPAAWVPAPGVSDEYCPLGPRGYVLEARGRIVGAAAQHLATAALLHHGTLSARADRELVRRLFPTTDPSALERLAGLEDLGVHEPSTRLAGAVAVALDAALSAAAGTS